MEVLEQYTGYISEVKGDDFVVVLKQDFVDEPKALVATISKTIVSEKDQKYIVPGAYFTWKLGHTVLESGQTKDENDFQIWSKVWTKEEIAEVRKEALQELARFFSNENSAKMTNKIG